MLRFPRGLIVRVLAVSSAVVSSAAASESDERRRIEAVMERATRFMVETVSHEGGYVWSYLPDRSRRWGELEAGPGMIWIQPPGTATMGEVFLDAYAATGDELYYDAAAAVGRALTRAQHESGGWNYCADFAGEESLRAWYATIGRSAWRLEEFQHYYGNATFDDSVTAAATGFLLRLHMARPSAAWRAALDRAIGFILAAQYANGAWPQRYPLMSGFSKDGHPDYSGFCTFNDDVAAENIAMLERCAAALSDPRLLEAARRGMDAFVLAQLPAPQAGWALQYTPDLQPAGARTYEPRALATHATAENIVQLFRFFRSTGDSRYLARVPEALDWLDSVALPEDLRRQTGRTHPTFVEIGTNRPLYLHREGSNAANGHYFVDEDPRHTVGHYASFRSIDVAQLRRELDALRRGELASPVAVVADSRTSRSVEEILGSLDGEGYWPAPLPRISHPYRGEPAKEVSPGDYASTQVGDVWDTSPFPPAEPVIGITTERYIENMRALIERLRATPRE